MFEHFGVGLLPSDGLRYSIDFGTEEKLECHEKIIRPLVYNSIETLVYGLDSDSQLFNEHKEILIKYKGKYKLDLNKEVIAGHESLWNSKNWERGSIVIVIDPNKINLKEIIQNCYRPGINATPRSGNTNSAINYCRTKAKEGLFSFCISASNGIEDMMVYGPQEGISRLIIFALKNSKEFDYWRKRAESVRNSNSEN